MSYSIFIIWNHPATFKVLAKRWYFILIAYHWHAKYFLSRKKTNNVTNDTATSAGYCTHVMKCWKYFIIMQRKKSLLYVTHFIRWNMYTLGYYLCDVRPVIIFSKTKIYQIQNFYDIILCLNERICVPACINTLKYYHEINPVIRFLWKNRNLKRLIRRENDID